MKLPTHLLIYVIIATTFFVGLASGYTIVQLQKSIDVSEDWREPPPLTAAIETREDALAELESLGCILISDVYSFGTFGNWISIQNYTEFRRIAFNTKIVFYQKKIEYSEYFYTVFNGVFIRYNKLD